LVQFDVLVTLSYGRPQAINLDDADVPPLTVQDFDGLDENVDADFVVHYAELCAIISRVLRERFALRASLATKTAALKRADSKLAQWMTDLPRSLRPGLPHDNVSKWPAILHINFNNFLILLHRPPPTFVATAHSVQTEDIGKSNITCQSFEGLTNGTLQEFAHPLFPLLPPCSRFSGAGTNFNTSTSLL
jgi:hypothetical protein